MPKTCSIQSTRYLPRESALTRCTQEATPVATFAFANA
jgi:hypothetical protein